MWVYILISFKDLLSLLAGLLLQLVLKDTVVGVVEGNPDGHALVAFVLIELLQLHPGRTDDKLGVLSLGVVQVSQDPEEKRVFLTDGHMFFAKTNYLMYGKPLADLST